ncbi:MAG: acetyl-CoA carboxylase, carboxyltransferase subunit beta [Defluviitaleaceae bacterium]|nr:acetyl-CoA carboxylase, carboxyltransferase subunit beta [Defluviitaleaceae bacterium]
MNIFNRKKYVTVPQGQTAQMAADRVPDGMWVKCNKCGKVVYNKQLGKYKICPLCEGYFRISAPEMIVNVVDEDGFTAHDADLVPENPINYPNYEEKIKQLGETLDIKEAVVTGRAKIHGIDTMICAMDSRFIMGSMGSVVGEKITRAFEAALADKLPIVVFTASGGARMQEGIVSLMQMGKVSAAVKRHSDAGLLYITVLTDPTTGGVTASFAMQGDIILAEPGALVGFAGRRVIEQTIKQKLPEDFQSAEFVLEHGFIDKIVPRPELRDTLGRLLKIHCQKMPPAQQSMDGFEYYCGGEGVEPFKAVEIARKVTRPTGRDIISYMVKDFVEMHGDRNFRDDGAIVGGIGYLNGMPITVVATQKGHNLEENVACNFGQPHPEGYRKALRIMKQAEKFGRPILTLINTSGAYPAAGAEERGQGSAIAASLFEMAGFTVPVVAVIVGEGGSGGAIALALADRVFMFEYSMYSILSPEGFASILWKDGKRAKEAAGVMKLRPTDLMELGIIEGIIPEIESGFENDMAHSLDYLESLLLAEYGKLGAMPTEDLLEGRYQRFRKFGSY